MKTNLLLACAAALLSSCAGLGPQRYEASKEVAQVRAAAEDHSTVTETSEPYIKATAVEYEEPRRNGVSLRVARGSLAGALEGLAKMRGWGVTYVEPARGDKPISVEIAHLPFERAVREVALAAGYVAVVDARRQQIAVAEEATFFFRVPAHLADRNATNYSVSANPGFGAPGGGGQGAGGGAGTGSTAGGAAQGGTTAGGANTVVSGSSVKSAEQLIEAIRSLAGGGDRASGRVQFVPEMALVSVRARANELRRINDLMDTIARESQYQIEVETALVEVSLTRRLQYGIDWSRLIPVGNLLGSGASLNLQVSTANVVAAPSLSATITTASVDSVIKALQGETDVRIVARPSAITKNNTDTVIHRGRQLPYLGEVSQSTVANAGTTVSGKLSFVPDGTSVALRASVIDSNRVELRIAPQQTSVTEFREFTVAQNTRLVGPVYPLSQAFLQLMVEQGKTYVIGGLNLDRDNDALTGLPGLIDVPIIGKLIGGRDRVGERTQFVMLVTARIIPPPPNVTSLIGESL